MPASRIGARTAGGGSDQEQQRRVASNDELYEIACSLSFAEELLADCECGHAHCTARLRMPLAHFKLARQATNARLVAPHHYDSADAIIYLTPAYWLVHC